MAITLTDEQTFVFTDIELSSAHWHRDESAMSRVMPLHNKLVETTFSTWNGTVLRGEGDSCAAIFATPFEALEASGDIQRGLANAAWEVPLRVRIGIHSGRVYHLYGTEYGGTPLNYLGRLHKVGHGGQILVSDVTASLLARSPAVGVGADRPRRIRAEGFSPPADLSGGSFGPRAAIPAVERNAAHSWKELARERVRRSDAAS